jgi:DNA polymerase III subunit beta
MEIDYSIYYTTHMLTQVLQESLTKALTTATRIASPKVQLPVLANALLKTDRNKLLISATNLETSVSITIGAKVEKAGEITIPAKTIADIVSNLSPGQIVLTADKEQLKIESSGFSGMVTGMNASDFPQIPDRIGENNLKIDKDAFLNALSKVLFAVSIDETRPVLTGLLILAGKEGLTFVATDGFRLSRFKIPLAATKELGEKSLILPKNTLAEISRISSGEGDKISFSYSEDDRQVIFETSNTVLSSRIIEGQFPDFEKIIPKDYSVKVNTDKNDLLRAVRLSAVFAREIANVVKITIKKGSLEMFAESGKSGSQKTQIEAKVEGEIDELTIAFNYKFLEDFINSVKGESVVMQFSDSSAPGVFLDPGETSYLHLIMPVKV